MKVRSGACRPWRKAFKSAMPLPALNGGPLCCYTCGTLTWPWPEGSPEPQTMSLVRPDAIGLWRVMNSKAAA